MNNIIDRNDIEGFFKVITGNTFGGYGRNGAAIHSSDSIARGSVEAAKLKGYDITVNDVVSFLKGDHLPGLIPVTPGREDFHEIPATDVVAEGGKSAEAIGLMPVREEFDHLQPGVVMELPAEVDKPRSKYHREVAPDTYVDVYDVLVAWNVTDPAIAHAIKKLLQPGARGVKSVRQDVEEAIVSLERARDLPFVGKCTTTV